jgi:hypothetical protein
MYKGAWDAVTKMSVVELVVLDILLLFILFLGWVLGHVFGNVLDFITISPLVPFAILVLAFVGVASQMSVNAFVDPETTPHGIVSFELAKDQTRADEIMTAWAEKTTSGEKRLLEVAQKDIKIDFAFILCYAALMGLTCFWIAAVQRNQLAASLGVTLGWSVLLAGLLDAIENLALLRMIAGGGSDLLAKIAFWTALPKLIVILYFALPYILLVGGFALFGFMRK